MVLLFLGSKRTNFHRKRFIHNDYPCPCHCSTASPIYISTGECASQKSDLVVVTTARRLREEIRSQLNEAELCKCQPQNCSTLHGGFVAQLGEHGEGRAPEGGGPPEGGVVTLPTTPTGLDGGRGC